MKDDELWFKTRFTIIWLPFWGDETQHAASLQLETKLGEKSKLACFGSEVLEFENQIKYYTFAWLDKSKQIIGIKQW